MYPKGYEITGDDGESLLAVLQKPLYGHPEAARAWSDTRNAWMAEKFNQDGWTAKQSDVDAALWIVTAPVTGNTILCSAALLTTSADESPMICPQASTIWGTTSGSCSFKWLNALRMYYHIGEVFPSYRYFTQ